MVAADTVWGGGSDVDSDRPRVFISHSAQPDPFADDLRRRLARRLAQDYEVLLDEQAIDPGDEWKSKLFRWLGICDAAIIMINQAVLDQPDWVRFETHVVSWRREFSRDVVVIPVLLPGVTADDLPKIGLGTALVDVGSDDRAACRELSVSLRDSPVALTAYQFVQVDGQGLDPVPIIDQIVEGLNSLEGRLRLTGPLADWVDEITRSLPEGLPLANAATALGVRDEFLQVVGPRQAVIQRELVAFTLLFSSDLDRVQAAVRALVRDGEFRRNLEAFLPQVIPTWVGEQFGLAVAAVRSGEKDRRVVAMDVGFESIADVVNRAICCSTQDLMVGPVSTRMLAEDATRSFRLWYAKELEYQYGVDNVDDAARPVAIAGEEKRLRAQDSHTFVAIDQEVLTAPAEAQSAAEAVEWLRTRFGGSVFVLNASDQLVADVTGEAEVPRCAPDIEPDREQQQRRIALQLQRSVDDRGRAGNQARGRW